jgi:hypothetical protein
MFRQPSEMMGVVVPLSGAGGIGAAAGVLVDNFASVSVLSVSGETVFVGVISMLSPWDDWIVAVLCVTLVTLG